MVVVVVNSWCWPGRIGGDRGVWLLVRWRLRGGRVCVVFVTLCIARGELVVWEALPKFVRASMLRRWGLCAGGQSAGWYTALLALSSLWCGGLDIGVCLRDGFIWCLACL
jgi:hypothetical protein